MPRVHHRKARKAYPDIGVQPGEMYYTWRIKLAYGGMTRRSKTYPRPSQLTNSAFLGQLGDLQADLPNCEDAEALRDIANTLREMGEEAQASLDNMPEGLQQGLTGQLLEERSQGCEGWADEIEQAADDLEARLEEIDTLEATDLDLADDATEDEIEQARQEKRGEARDEAVSNAESGCPF